METAPVVFKILLQRALGRSKTDLKTDLIVSVITAMLRRIRFTPMLQVQQRSTGDPGVKRPLWAREIVLPVPEQDGRMALIRSVEEMSQGGHERYTRPKWESVYAEWATYRADLANTPPLVISEESKYLPLAKERTSNATVLYFHGGLYHVNDPVSFRLTTSGLAKGTGARIPDCHLSTPSKQLFSTHLWLFFDFSRRLQALYATQCRRKRWCSQETVLEDIFRWLCSGCSGEVHDRPRRRYYSMAEK